ncbi:fumarylacetoacetate hydrolase family protein [Magnetospirillum sp. SS-4]|uniref:fumarylacetoacetate hydrolase family protein n=1 Tax=Magnetospirillum sp. SS-4 TaxID=2681465 RepID=UPI00138040CF|nr:fumarylacetoacetate hydrolase family protein [Magnetospirillum sp. SS-4]CAA7622206.1 Fumarylpyruvate hydrolase [Magnetospirillum sp. SS-4]
MTATLFHIPQPAVPVVGEAAVYPVRRVFCVARNYAGHAREMGSDPSREAPFYFTKPADALVPGGGEIPYPPATANLHHEVELVVALSAPVFRASPAEAARAVFGHAIGLDLTRRDLQTQAKDMGRPWCLGKAFEHSAPISPILRAAAPLVSGDITLEVNGEVRQHGDISDMIWPIPDLVAHLSNYYHLGEGDLIFTGTPEGVGPVRPGDVLTGRIAGLGELRLVIGPES